MVSALIQVSKDRNIMHKGSDANYTQIVSDVNTRFKSVFAS